MDETLASTADKNRQRLLNEEAAAWLLRLENDSSLDTETEFRRWIERSADHVQTFLEVTAIDRDLYGLDAQRQVDLDELIAAVRDDAPNIFSLPKRTEILNFDGSRRRRLGWSAAAAVSALAVLSGLFLTTRHFQSDVYKTALGEQRAVKLEDGSLVQLNTLTRIEVHYTGHAREVRLLEGEALFTVERDGARPFRVVTGSTVVQALGTQFNIYRRNGSMTVSVVDGRVKISSVDSPVANDAPAADRAVLSAGEAAHVESGLVTRQGKDNVAKSISWRQRQLSFDHDALSQVVEQFNRYNRLQIRIVDAELSRRELEGVFNADEPQALLDFLKLDRGLKFEQRGDELLISKSDDFGR